jgi:hypothetical protein
MNPRALIMQLLRRLEGWPRALRWAAFLPAGVAAAVIVESVLDGMFDAAGVPELRDTEGLSREALTAFGWALTLTLVPAVLSPRPWPVGLVMFVVGLLWRAGPILYLVSTTPYMRPRFEAVAVPLSITFATHALGGVLGLYLVRYLTRVERDSHGARIGEVG